MVLIPLAARVEQGCRRRISERAFVALISASVIVTASRAGSLNETVGQEKLVVFTVRLVGCLESEEAIIVQVFVNLLSDTEGQCRVTTAGSPESHLHGMFGSRRSAPFVEANFEPPVTLTFPRKDRQHTHKFQCATCGIWS